MNSEMKLIVIHGAKDKEGLDAALLKWVSDVLAQRAEFEPWFMGPADLMAKPDKMAAIQRQETLRHLADADAFLFITSQLSDVYHSGLKAFFDQVSVRWHARPVAFIGYGGASGGLCAIDHLRQVLSAQHAVPISNYVSFTDPWSLIDEAGHVRQTDQARLPMARMLVQLNWWASTLKAAREQMPYVLVS
ncbi:NAD(P)H-dependent oxidoreductase [Pseudomonas sp. Sample_16]|uniref:NADPH-dependent FMN reductase n=1 Tax=Pseudomonas sp. Sample_16 TaxID=2448263 RepID=UPI0010328859|nr:NAD(P)H-dependent oxidoreductase [Pseudomonas sp. Sample_16]